MAWTYALRPAVPRLTELSSFRLCSKWEFRLAIEPLIVALYPAIPAALACARQVQLFLSSTVPSPKLCNLLYPLLEKHDYQGVACILP